MNVALLDVDGTLIDSNDAQADSWVEALRGEGFQNVRFEDVRRLIGLTDNRILEKVAGLDERSETGRKISERRKRLFLEAYLPKLKPFAGARDLCLRLRAEGYRLALANSPADEVHSQLIKKAGVADLFEPLHDGSIEATLQNLSAEKHQAILFGDTPYDIAAAKRAGLRAIAFRSGGWSPEELRGALAVYDGPADCLRNFAASALVPPERREKHLTSGVIFPM